MRPKQDRAAEDGPPRVAVADACDECDACEAWDDLLRGAARDARLLAAGERAWIRERSAWARDLWATSRDVQEQAETLRHKAMVECWRATDGYIAALQAWTRAEEVRALASAAAVRARLLLRMPVGRCAALPRAWCGRALQGSPDEG
jgi:hypothetical protein